MEDNNTPIYRVALANGKSKDYTEKEYRDLDIAGWLDQNHHGQYNVFKLSNAPADSVTKDQQYVVSITQNGQTKSKLYSGQEFMDLDMNGWLEANHSGNYQIQSVRGYSDASLAVNEDTWKKQAEQQKAALDKFDEDNKSFMRQHEADTLVYDAGEGVMVDNDKYRQDELKYQELANQRQALQSEYSNNPYIRSQYKAEAEYADQKAAEYEAEKNKRSKDDDDYRYFSQARKLEMDAAKTWAVDVAQAPGENGFADYMSNYGKGAGKVFSDRDFWTRGISAISRDLNVRKIFKKLQDKGFNLNTITEKELDENLTPGEKALIFSFIRLADAQAARAKDMAPGYTAGQTAADSVGFMAEFFISGGIGKVAGSALKEGVQQGLRAFIGRALTTGSAEAIRSATSRGMINAFTKGGQRALTQGMKQAVKAGTAAATGVYKYGVRPVEEAAWHTALQLSTYRTIADDLTQIDNNGKLVEAGTAIWGGVLDSFVENWSESMGDFVNDVIGLPFKGAAGLGKKLLGETSLTQWGRWLADTTAAKVLTQAGFHGLIGEMGEEWVGNAARVGLGLMSGDEFKDFRDLHNQLDMAASFAPMSLFGLGSSSYAAAREAKNYRQTVESFRGVLNRTEGMTQEEIANIFDTKHTKTEIADILTPVLQKIVHGRETNSTAFEDYITTLKMAQALSMHEVVSTAQSVEKNLARDEMRRQIETELGSTTDADGRGKFTHRMATERLDENGNPYEVEAVTTVKDAEGNEWFYMGDNGSQVVLKKRGEAGGKPMFLTQTEYEQRVESGEFTQKTQLASQFLDEQVQQKRTAERQARANQEIQDRYSALLKRFHNDPNINLGTEDAPLNGTVMSVGYDGVIVDFGQPVLLNGETLAIHKLSLEQAGNAVGLDTSMRSEEQRDADAVDRDEKARKRVASYNRTFSGKDFTINGDPYTYVKMFEAPFLDENGNEMVRVVATDAQGVDVEVALPLADLESQALTQQEREQSDANIERTDEETSADNSGSPKDFRGNDIPMRVNEKTGEEEVDKREFKKRDPEAYYNWNDSRRGGNTADSMEAIQADIAAKSKERETLAKQKSAETDPDMRDELEGQITRLDNEINLLSRIYHKYDAANNFQEVEKRYKEQFQEIRQRLLHAKSQEQIDELQQKQRVLYLRYIMETEGSKRNMAINEHAVELQKAVNEIADLPVQVTTHARVVEDMTNDGASQDWIDEVTDMLARLKREREATGIYRSVGGFHCNGKVYIFAEGNEDVNAATITYYHERQHNINKHNPGALKAVSALFKGNRKALFKTLESIIGDAWAYRDKSASVLADEIVAYTMEKAHTNSNYIEELKALGLSDELINIISTEYGRQQGTSQVRDRESERDSLSDDSGQANYRIDAQSNGRESGDERVGGLRQGDAAAETESGEVNIGRESGQIQGLENYSRDELKGFAEDYVNGILKEQDIDASILGVEIHGSRNRGDAGADSDLDIVLAYDGDIREDDMFNLLNDEESPLVIDGVRVDINPIRKEESGSLEDYMQRSAAYDEQKRALSPTGKTAEEVVNYSIVRKDEVDADSYDYWQSHKDAVSEENYSRGQQAMDEMAAQMRPYYGALAKGNRILPLEQYGGKDAKSTIFNNASYGRTIENTLKCMRTLAYNEFTDAVKEKLGRPLTQRESFLASQMVYDIATDPQCLYCYVSLDRKAYDGFLLKYVEQRDAILEKYRALPNKYKSIGGKAPHIALDSLYKEFLSGRQDTSHTKARFDSWIRNEMDGTPVITTADLTTKAVRNAILNGLDAKVAAQMADAQRYAQNASRAKKDVDYISYIGELLKMSPNVVHHLLEEYGLRFYSFSEFTPAFILENMQMVRDAALRGLNGLAYTKEIDFVKIFAPTGMNINISCYGRRDADGNFVMDSRQGADWEEAKKLREQYPNVAISFTVTNDEDVNWALEQDFVDVIIPFHIVMTGEDIANFYGWTNYSAKQADQINGTQKKKYISPVDHHNNKEHFLALCKEENITPRFVQFVEHPNYMRLVNETRRSIDETVPLQPVFDTVSAQDCWNRFVEKGGYYNGWWQCTPEEYIAVVDRVVEDVKAGKEANQVDYGRQDIPINPERAAAAHRRARQHGNRPLYSGFKAEQQNESAEESNAEIRFREVSERKQWIGDYVNAVHLVTGKDKKAIRAELNERVAEAKEEARELYGNVLSGNFNSVTLQQIDNYIDNATNGNRFYRPLSQRLRERALLSLQGRGRTGEVDALFSRICESAVPANERTRAEGRRKIEARKEELLEGWAKATGNWHESIADFTSNTEPIGHGTDSEVYLSYDGESVIKASKGKFDNNKFPTDIDQVALFNSVFPRSAYTILGYGRVNGKFVKYLEQQLVDFNTSTPLSVEERVAYMRQLGYEPQNEDQTVFSNGDIVVSDLQKSNIVRDAAGNVRVIDADVKLHTKDIGGNYTYAPVEYDTDIDGNPQPLEANTESDEPGMEEASVEFRTVQDPALLDRLNNEETISVYQSAVKIGDNYYPPMATLTEEDENGRPKLGQPVQFGTWLESEEHPERIAKSGRYKGRYPLREKGKTTWVSYNPYLHTTASPLNDQFTAAHKKPLVVLEVRVPKSELAGTYHAEGAQDSTGEKPWHKGPVSAALAKLGKDRKVILTRWAQPVREVPAEEIADKVADMLDGTRIAIPINVVTPDLRDALAERGVKFGPVRGTVGEEEKSELQAELKRIKTLQKEARKKAAETGSEAQDVNLLAEANADQKKAGGSYVSPADLEQVRFMTVYHGSGAQFDRFDSSYMGTGEGNQAFGWGHYVTEVEGIGKTYVNNVVFRNYFDGSIFAYGVSNIRSKMRDGASFEAARDSLVKSIESNYEADDRMPKNTRESLDRLNALTEETLPKGNLYTVEIPEDTGENYFDWFARADSMIDRIGISDEEYEENDLATGEDVYHYLESREGGAKQASEFLASLGYVGIKYPANTRGGGREDGAKNYVIFNDEDLQITDNIRFRLSNNNRATIGKWLDKWSEARVDALMKRYGNGTTRESWVKTMEDSKVEILDYLDNIQDATTQLAWAKWFCAGAVQIGAEDMPKVRQAIKMAKAHKVDPLQFDSPMAIINQWPGEIKEDPINPDEVNTLHKAKVLPEGLVIYDVDESEESRKNMRNIINTHFGKDCSPWCLLQGTKEGKLTAQSKKYWNHYNIYPKQVVFKNGKLLAFSANDTSDRVWWDKQDKSHDGIPVIGKIKGDKLGRAGNIEYDPETGEQGEITDIHKGNKQNGHYQEWRNLEAEHPWVDADYKDGKLEGKYITRYSSGAVQMEQSMADGVANGECTTYRDDGTVWTHHVAKNGRIVGESVAYHQDGSVESSTEYDENGQPTGNYRHYHPNGNIFTEGIRKENTRSFHEYAMNGTEIHREVERRSGENGIWQLMSEKRWDEDGKIELEWDRITSPLNTAYRSQDIMIRTDYGPKGMYERSIYCGEACRFGTMVYAEIANTDGVITFKHFKANNAGINGHHIDYAEYYDGEGNLTSAVKDVPYENEERLTKYEKIEYRPGEQDFSVDELYTDFYESKIHPDVEGSPRFSVRSFEAYKGEEALDVLNSIFEDKSEKDSLPPVSISTLDEFRRVFANPVNTIFNETIKVKDDVFNKIIKNSRSNILEAILPTLEDADFGIKDIDESILYVKRYANGHEKPGVYNIAVVNKHGELEDYISSVHIKTDNNLKNKIGKGAELLIPNNRDTYGNNAQSNSTPSDANVANNSENATQSSENEPMFRTVEITPKVREEMEVIEAKARVNGTYLQAPNGAATKLSAENWAFVRTDEFKNWFGDWELALKINNLVNIIKADKEHGFKNFAEAKEWAGKNIARLYTNNETGGKGDINISKKILDKFLSESSVRKSVDKDTHLAVLKVLPDIIREGIDAEQHPDIKKDENGERKLGNEINENVTIHRVYGAVEIGGTLHRVKITLKEDRTQGPTKRVYNYEATKIELLDGQSATPVGVPRNSNNSISVANLLNGVEKSYEKGKKLLDVSKIVDENGEPRVVYHQTNSTIWVNRKTGQNFDDLDWEDKNYWQDEASQEEWEENWEEQDFYTFDNKQHGRTSSEMPAFFFSPKFDENHEYGERTIAAFLNIKNPAVNPEIENAGKYNDAGEKAMQKLIEQGYDGFIREYDGETDEINAFYPNQIKSATDYNGEVSSSENDIRLRMSAGSPIFGENGIEDGERENNRTGVLGDAGRQDGRYVRSRKPSRTAQKTPKNYEEDREAEAERGEERSGEKRTEANARVNDGIVLFRLIGEQAIKNIPEEESLRAQVNLEIAKQMKAAGKSTRAILDATGWQFGKDGKPRFEEPDFKKSQVGTLVSYDGRTGMPLEDLIDDPRLFSEYPELKDWRIKWTSGAPNTGWTSASDKLIGIAVDGNLIEGEEFREAIHPYAYNGRGKYPTYTFTSEGRGTLVHELQHAIQHFEGFAPGTSPEALEKMLRNKINDIRADYVEFTKAESDASKTPEAEAYRDAKAKNLDKETCLARQAEFLSTPEGKKGKVLMDNFVKKYHFGPYLWREAENQAEHRDPNEGEISAIASFLYEHESGEVESFTVERRKSYSDERRKSKPFYLDESIPRSMQWSLPAKQKDTADKAMQGLQFFDKEAMTDMLMKTFSDVPSEIRAQITDKAPENGYNFGKASVDYFSGLAEREDELTAEEKEAVTTLRDNLKEALGIDILSLDDTLWSMFQTQTAGERDILTAARRAIVADRLGHTPAQEAKRKQAEDEIRYSIRRDMQSASEAEMYNRANSYAWNRLKESWVDMHESVNNLVEAVEIGTGRKAESFEDIRLALNQQSSKGLNAMQKYTSDYLEPMWEAIDSVMKTTGMTYEDVVRYVMLKHAVERNDVFARRDAKAFYKAAFDNAVNPLRQERKQLEKDRKKALADGDTQLATDCETRMQEIDLQIADEQKRLDRHYTMVDNGTAAKYRELRENDYGGLTSMFSDYPGLQPRNMYRTEEEYNQTAMAVRQPRYQSVAEMEAAALAEVDAFERRASGREFDNLWSRINAATKATLESQYRSNVISKEQYEAARDQFQYYVPLRGFKDTTAEDLWTYYNTELSGSFAPALLGAKGRKSEAGNPFNWIGTMASSAIAQNIKNESKLALYYFIANRPNQDLVTIQDVWYQFDQVETDRYRQAHPGSTRKIFTAVYPPFTESLSSDAAKQVYDSWTQGMEQMAQSGLAYKRTNRLNVSEDVAFIDAKQEPQHVIRAKVRGKEVCLIINGSPRAAQAINGLLNVEADNDILQKVAGGFLRFLSAVNTSFNPEFWMSNMQRDLLFATMGSDIKGDGAGNFGSHLVTPAKLIKMAKAYKNNTLGNSQIENYYREFAEGGAITGYTVVNGNAYWEKKISEYIDKPVWRKAIEGIRLDKFLQYWQNLGEAVEQMARFAAYVTAREGGKDIAASVNAAKEISVNFNRKGSGKMITAEELKTLTTRSGRHLNGAEKAGVFLLSFIPWYGRKFIMFFNASVQALNAMYKLWKANPKYNVPQISDRRLSQKKTITLQRNGKDNTKKVHPGVQGQGCLGGSKRIVNNG